jgi:hypothetical protein
MARFRRPRVKERERADTVRFDYDGEGKADIALLAPFER